MQPQIGMRQVIKGRSINVENNTRIKLGSWNVGTMHQRANKFVETMGRRNIDICCIQETRCLGGSARAISENRSKYNFFWNGNETGYGGVGVLIKEELIENVLPVERVNNRIMSIGILLGKMMSIKSIYAPQSARSATEKDELFTKLMGKITKVQESETLVIAGDLRIKAYFS